jgi:signal transduction histidine kinase
VPRLIVIKGADEGKQFELSEPLISVGREASNLVRLHDTEVSRRHAELHRLSDGNYRLVDVGSANGCQVNTRRVKEAMLNPGDHIQIGQTILVYSTGRNDSSASELADRIRLVTRQDLELSSAIIKKIGENEGSQILLRPDQARTQWLKVQLANLAIMYETIQAVSHILDVDQMLERIMELIFRSIEADDGCILLHNPETGQFEPKAVRSSDPARSHEKIVVSRTITEYVLREKQGVLVNDAAQDTRFNSGQSIVRLNIHEAICVPMKGRHETLGVLYLGTHSHARDIVERGVQGKPGGKFTEDHLALAIAIAHQAALAIEETRYHQSLLQAERLAAIGQTIASMSHHIKNILQGLQSGREIVRLGLAEKDEALIHQGWRIVEKNQAKIEDLVKDMLSYSKEREPNLELADLNQIVADVVELMQNRAAELKVRLVAKPAPDLPLAPVDPEGIHRALLNIVSNALDAVEEVANPQVIVGTLLETDGAWVQVQVVDNGVGIPPDKLQEIFKPFVSTKGARGTGLGLAVSRKILREHGGDITVQSQLGKGSRFILRLPMKSPQQAESNNATLLPMQPPPPN